MINSNDSVLPHIKSRFFEAHEDLARKASCQIKSETSTDASNKKASFLHGPDKKKKLSLLSSTRRLFKSPVKNVNGIHM